MKKVTELLQNRRTGAGKMSAGRYRALSDDIWTLRPFCPPYTDSECPSTADKIT